LSFPSLVQYQQTPHGGAVSS